VHLSISDIRLFSPPGCAAADTTVYNLLLLFFLFFNDFYQTNHLICFIDIHLAPPPEAAGTAVYCPTQLNSTENYAAGV